MKNEALFRDTPVWKAILSMAVPSVFTVLVMIVYNMADLFFVGRLGDTAQVGAISVVGPVFSVLSAVSTMIGVGGCATIAKALGAGNSEDARTCASLCGWIFLLFGGGFAVIVLLFTDPLLQVLGATQDMWHYAGTYMRILALGAPVMLFSQGMAMLIRAEGAIKEGLIGNVSGTVVNLILDPLFILVMNWGVAGAAISSNLSRMAGLAIMLRLFYKKLNARFSIRYLRPFPTKMLRQLLRIGLPSGGESLSYNMTQVFIMTFVNLFGAVSINTKVYASMFAMCSYLFSSAIGQASQVIVGYLVGAGDLRSANRQVWYTCRLSMLVSLGVASVLWVLSKPIFGIFTSDSAVIELGAAIMFIEIFLEWGRSVNIVMVRCLQAAGDIRFPVVLGILSAWTVAVLGGYLIGVAAGYGLIGIWAAMACDECIRAVVFLFRWKSGAWKNRAFVEPREETLPEQP